MAEVERVLTALEDALRGHIASQVPNPHTKPSSLVPEVGFQVSGLGFRVSGQWLSLLFLHCTGPSNQFGRRRLGRGGGSSRTFLFLRLHPSTPIHEA
jgi:hypothetical protein